MTISRIINNSALYTGRQWNDVFVSFVMTFSPLDSLLRRYRTLHYSIETRQAEVGDAGVHLGANLIGGTKVGEGVRRLSWQRRAMKRWSYATRRDGAI